MSEDPLTLEKIEALVTAIRDAPREEPIRIVNPDRYKLAMEAEKAGASDLEIELILADWTPDVALQRGKKD